MKAHRLVQGKHNFKTHAFLKACVSYAHITIPSIDDAKKQFRLSLLTAQVALINNLIGEAESIVKTAISKIPVMAEEEELSQVEENLNSLVGLMVLLPDNPSDDENCKFFLPAHGLINALNSLNKRYEKLKYRLLVNILWYLSSQTQSKLPLRIFRVDSNDKLMSGNERFKASQMELIQTITEEILNFVGEVGELKTIDDGSFDILVKFTLALEKVFFAESNSQVAVVINKVIAICKKFRGEAQCKMLRTVN
jgi:hypothetical protein